MNMKKLRIISIFIIMVIAIGCVNKSQENENQPIENQPIDKPILITDTDNNRTFNNETPAESKETAEDVPIDPPIVTQTPSTPSTTPNTPIAPSASDNTSDNISTQSDNTTIQSDKPTTQSDNISTNSSGTINDTSISATFKIGEEKNLLGINIKLVNITDYNSNSVILNIDGIEYTYDSEANIQVKGRKIIDVITSEDDQTAEIAVDYTSQ